MCLSLGVTVTNRWSEVASATWLPRSLAEAVSQEPQFPPRGSTSWQRGPKKNRSRSQKCKLERSKARPQKGHPSLQPHAEGPELGSGRPSGEGKQNLVLEG